MRRLAAAEGADNSASVQALAELRGLRARLPAANLQRCKSDKLKSLVDPDHVNTWSTHSSGILFFGCTRGRGKGILREPSLIFDQTTSFGQDNYDMVKRPSQSHGSPEFLLAPLGVLSDVSIGADH
ncbi:hypothetical protein XH99_29505 [Bradyrhizobium nanningense]|uniref:Uncharacterized protein n=1 Tax=Bradyrhizobium nanningense TaxID=1325118 RepID=A0A4V1L1C8_9BRAD|nr:hypothetical protein XH99_29505 [Bradyrhizobium nanningense]RXH29244.1 hypothetical protein XH84_22280 [Bradyrhizobium nanningense]